MNNDIRSDPTLAVSYMVDSYVLSLGRIGFFLEMLRSTLVPILRLWDNASIEVLEKFAAVLARHAVLFACITNASLFQL